MGLLNAFTVDVEDYFQVSAFEKDIRRNQWDQFNCRVEGNTRRILELLDRHGVKATFFVLGWLARRYRDLVRDIHRSGHEIGSHGYWHRLIYEQSPEQFRANLRRSRNVLEDAIGEPVTAHRAASFSITRRSIWALDILAAEGFLVDSSIFPTSCNGRYGIPDAETGIHRVATSAGPLWEFPPSVVRLARRNLPVGGGGYLRLFPLAFTSRCLAAINSRVRRPFLVYVHPWELDPEQPRLRAASRAARFRHYVNLAKTEHRLDVLLRRFRFGRVCDVLEQCVPNTDY